MRYSKAYDEYTREPRTTTFNHEPRPLTAYHAARTILKSLPIAIRSTRAWASATTMHVAWPITITPTNYKEYIMFIGTFLVFTLIVVLSGGSGLAQLLMNHEQRSEKTHEKD